jgi:hypothetical protein
MSTTNRTPQSILSLPPETKSPEAYRVLGLAVFEADRVKIKLAAERTFARLKDVKSSSDAAAWETANQWTKNAYAILGDPSKKAAYDRKLAAENASKPPVVDPLAGVLPGAPTRPTFHPGNAPQISSSIVDPLAGTLPNSLGVGNLAQSPPGPPGANILTAEVAIPSVGHRRSTIHRRRFPWGAIFLSLFCLVMIAGLGGLLYLVQRGNPIVINTSGRPLVGSADDPDGDGQMVAPPGKVAVKEKRPFDPVMGGLAGDMPPPQAPVIVDETGQATSAVNEPAMPASPTAEPSMPVPPATSESPPMTPIPAVPAPDPSPTPEQIKAGEVAILAVSNAIKQHDWVKLKSLAEKAESMAATDPQKEQAEMLFQLADLATFYRGAIEKAIGTLEAGHELDVSTDLKVVIVETSANKLIVRFNGRNKEYTYDSLPLLLAHKLALLTLPADSPTNQAAKYSYQAIASITTADYRAAAIKELEKITDEVTGAEPAKLVAAIRYVYPQ